jgi:hypothetical protein
MIAELKILQSPFAFNLLALGYRVLYESARALIHMHFSQLVAYWLALGKVLSLVPQIYRHRKLSYVRGMHWLPVTSVSDMGDLSKNEL